MGPDLWQTSCSLVAPLLEDITTAGAQTTVGTRTSALVGPTCRGSTFFPHPEGSFGIFADSPLGLPPASLAFCFFSSCVYI